MLKKRMFLPIFLFITLPLLYGGSNLLKNPGMEESSIEPWRFWAYEGGISTGALTGEFSRSGKQCALIINRNDNDARLYQRVNVKKGATYKISGWIKTKTPIDGGKGANLSILGFYTMSNQHYNTNGKWEYSEMLIRIGDNVSGVDVGLSQGGYGGVTKGTVYFDDISMEEIPYTPKAYLIEKAPPPGEKTNSESSQSENQNLQPYSIRKLQVETFVLWIIFIISAVGTLAILLFTKNNKTYKGEKNERQ